MGNVSSSALAPTLRIRKDAWTEAFEEAGAFGDQSVAELLGMDRSSVYRVVTGKTVPGPRFIAAVLSRLAVDFEDVFEVVGGTVNNRTSTVNAA
jgi:predicted DNA-binding transcriptional regulator AlpA